MLWSSTPTSLLCYYCNQRTTKRSKERLRDWTCPNCEALNVINQDGSIADEIPSKYQKKAKDISYVKPSTSSTLSTPFCSVCTSNQALLVKTLASYLPDDDHPDVWNFSKEGIALSTDHIDRDIRESVAGIQSIIGRALSPDMRLLCTQCTGTAAAQQLSGKVYRSGALADRFKICRDNTTKDVYTKAPVQNPALDFERSYLEFQ